MRGTAPGSARLSALRDRGWHVLAAFCPDAVRGCKSLCAQGRRARLDRDDLAETIWRARAHLSRTLCRNRGDAGAPRPDPRLLDRGSAERPDDPALRPAGD